MITLPRPCLPRTTAQILGRRLAVPVVAVVLAVAAFAAQPASAQVENIVYSFQNGSADGHAPYGGVVRDSAGNLYGTTAYGGAFNHGTVFQISKHVRTLLHSFTGKADGGFPIGLVRDAAGNLYGTTQAYGASNCGTLFKLTTAGKFSVLHTFTDSPDGCIPNGPMRDAKGNLYGTTVLGGSTNSGTVYKVDAAGHETILHSFIFGRNGGTDGASPSAGVIRDAAGNLYGTTTYGGVDTFGTVYKVDAAGNETVLHAFTGGNTDGEYPWGVLARDASGNLYGTTQIGGTGSGGTIFKVDATGKESVLFNFTLADQGGQPQSSLVMDSAGNLYGNTGLRRL